MKSICKSREASVKSFDFLNDQLSLIEFEEEWES